MIFPIDFAKTGAIRHGRLQSRALEFALQENPGGRVRQVDDFLSQAILALWKLASGAMDP